MTIEWLAGNRIRGTTAERPNLGLPSGSVGGWVEVGRTTLGSAGDDITVSSLPDKRYYMVLSDLQDNGSSISSQIRLGNSSIDTGSNYAKRTSKAGGADATATSQSTIDVNTGFASNEDSFNITYITNKSDKEKLIQNWWTSNATGAGNAPYRIECVAKWANTSNSLDIFNNHNAEAGSYNTGSEVVVLGWDPDDTHTTNFWEELASVDLSGGSATSLTATASSKKKYNWIQYVLEGDSSASGLDIGLRLGDGTADSGNNWARRFSINGGADNTDTSQNHGVAQSSSLGNGEFQYGNLFFINNSANEKLMILHNVGIATAGAGTAPERREIVQKWVNTSAQADIFQLLKIGGTGSLDLKTQINWWGSD